MDTSTAEDVKTFRGRSLEELLPQIRAELGPDAIVVRRREGLAGGVAGFFQRSFVEVEARSPLPGEPALESRNDRATAEGLASPAVQALVEQASPFADALARAETSAADRAHDILLQAAAAHEPAAPVAAGLYGPQPNPGALAEAGALPLAGALEDAVAAAGAPPLAGAPSGVPAFEPVLPDVEPAAPPAFAGIPAGVARPAAADAAERRLVAAGLSPALAADLVGEAVAHGLPFAHPRGLKGLVRRALARRLATMADLGSGPRTLAFVGAPGAGRTAATALLARAYARAGADVVVVALRSQDGGGALAAALAPLGVRVIAAQDGAGAAEEVARRPAAMTIVDAPAAGLADAAGVARLAAELRALGAGEVHLALPATLSAPAAEELAAALAPVGITHVALTHADGTTRPGAAVELAAASGRPLSYVCTREALEPADAEALSRRLLP